MKSLATRRHSPHYKWWVLSCTSLGMLIASPLAGIRADRHGSRGLAALGMLVSAVGLAGMTMLQAHTRELEDDLVERRKRMQRRLRDP